MNELVGDSALGSFVHAAYTDWAKTLNSLEATVDFLFGINRLDLRASTMTTFDAHVRIDGDTYSYPVEGSFFTSDDGTLYQVSTSAIDLTNWRESGYCVVDLFSNAEFEQLVSSITRRMASTLRELGVETSDEFRLVDYHKYVSDLELHVAVTNCTKNFKNDDFGFDLELVCTRLSQLVGKKLNSYNPELQRKHVQLRISRPESLDINPPHRDGYLDYYKKILNVWIPVDGCDKNSSLPVVPGSHLIPEADLVRTQSQGAKISGNTYMVPCISKINGEFPEMVRPNPQPAQALIFTPFLIHGAAFNTNADSTRMALELRLYLENDDSQRSRWPQPKWTITPKGCIHSILCL